MKKIAGIVYLAILYPPSPMLLYFNKLIFFLAFILSVEPLFSNSPSTESYTIYNNSEGKITIQIKFKDGIRRQSAIAFYEDGNVIGGTRVYSMCGNNTFFFPPNDFLTILECLKEIKVDPIKKIRTAIEYLNIYDENNNLVITMDDINEDSFTLISGNMENPFTMTAFRLYVTPETVEAGRKKYGTTSIFRKAIKPPIKPAQRHPTLLPPVLGAQQKFALADNFVHIPGGTFTMGSPDSELNRSSDEGPRHKVTVSSFYMGKYEVTQAEYKAVMRTNPSNFTGDTLPVEQVNWFDAVNYCNELSRKEGLTPAYTINGINVTWNRNAQDGTAGYRLPTEAEWEYACRAGTKAAYNSGKTPESLAGQANVADLTVQKKYPDWTIVNIRDGYVYTAPVGSFAPNAWGLYDMHGNVYEWCWDWYGNYTGESQSDPKGASSGLFRVGRGGSWSDFAPELRSAFRYFDTSSNRRYDTGFRLVRPNF